MPSLTTEHIAYITKDLNYRGIILEGFQDEVIDHVCSAVEKEMGENKKFIDAYHHVISSFGHTAGLRKVQAAVIQTKNTPSIMIRSYLKIAYRNHLKQKFYTFINVAGLATGIAACMVIMLFVLHELSYDRFHEKADRIFRLNTRIKFGSLDYRLASGNAMHAELMAHDFPEVEATLRLRNWGPRFVRRAEDDERLRENLLWSDSTFFSLFSVPILEGDVHNALKEPNTVAISRKMARKYFPEGNAAGKSLIIDDNWNHRVTAVYEDLPSNSHFHVDMITSMAALDDTKNTSLVGGPDFYTYLLLREGSSAKALEAKFPEFVVNHIGPQIAGALGGEFTMEKFSSDGNVWALTLTALTDIHLHGDMINEVEANGDLTYIYLFSLIAFFILFIACINFMNLSTARSANRAKEVGVRKVMGSMRSHLIRQFLTESFLLSLASFIIAVALAYFFMPAFNNLAGKTLALPLTDFSFYLALLGATIAVGMLAGLYPSFFLSGFKPVNVLKGRLSLGMKSGLIRSGLVVFQFVISIFLIIGTIAITRQLNFIQEKKIGFKRDQVIVVHEAGLLGNQIQSFKNEVLRNNFIASGTISGYLPVAGTWRGSDTFWKEGRAPSAADVDEMVSLQVWRIDTDYMKTLGMNIKYGRNFSPEFISDSVEAVILNESAVENFDFGDNAVGKKITSFGGNRPDGTPDPENIRTWTVIGVVEDFHFESMRDKIRPLAFFLDRGTANVAFRFESTSAEQVLAAVGGVWKILAPGHTFQYSFLDDDFGRMYNTERRLGKVFAVFAGLAILIACLGLFALTAFTAEQRTKEIGIRKVLGASVNSIVMILSRDFSKLIAIAFVLSVPVSWYAVYWWMKDYAYKAEVGISVYLLAGAIAFTIALFTMGYQSVKAATSDPVKSLRSE